MHYHTAQSSHPGGRERQEDSLAVLTTPDQARALLAVADGMGGHRGGELASRAVTDTVTQAWDTAQAGVADPKAFLAALCQQANQAILKVAQDTGLHPHSTCVFLWLEGAHAWWAHVGDSRLYHLRGGAVLFRSKDHSVVQMLVNSGELNEADMATHPDQGRLLKGLGDAKRPLQPSLGQAEVLPGDSFLLCSDGLWERFSPQEIGRALQHPMPLEKIAEQLVKEAARRGGKEGDNVSAALARTQETMPRRSSRRLLWAALTLIWLTAGGLGAWWYLTAPINTPPVSQPNSPVQAEKIVPAAPTPVAPTPMPPEPLWPWESQYDLLDWHPPLQIPETVPATPPKHK